MSDQINNQASAEEAAQLTDASLEEVAGGASLQDIIDGGGCVFNPTPQFGTAV